MYIIGLRLLDTICGCVNVTIAGYLYIVGDNFVGEMKRRERFGVYFRYRNEKARPTKRPYVYNIYIIFF